jgi:hypothetical protein
MGQLLGGEDAFSIDNPPFQRQQPFLYEIKKVTGSQDDVFVVSWRCKKQRLL